MTEILLVVHIPLWDRADTLSNMRKIVTVDEVPAVGELFALPDGTRAEISHHRDLGQGRTSVHLGAPHVLRALFPGGANDGAASIAAARSLAEDLRASGFSGVTEWDT